MESTLIFVRNAVSEAADKGLTAYQVAKRTGISAMEAGRILLALAEKGQVVAKGAAGDLNPLAEEYIAVNA